MDPLEELWRGVFDAAPDAIVLVDASNTVVAANQRCAAAFGHEPATLVGLPVRMLLPDLAERARAEAEEAPVRATGARADGPRFPVEVVRSRVRAADATYDCLTIRDLSSRVHEEERFRSLLEAAPDAMVIVDADASIVLTNRQVVNLFGYEPSELLGRPIETLVPERYRSVHGAMRDGFLRQPTMRPMGSGRSLHAVRKDGSEFAVEISLAPVVTDEGVLISATVRDISERLRLQEESDRLRDELVATVSHELRTPLTSIIGYLELLRDLEEDSLSDNAVRMLGVIERNATRELRLVNDLLDLSTLDGGIAENALHEVSLGGVARAAAEGVRVTAQSKDVDLVVDVPEGLEVRADPLRLAQVLDNLVTNALKFTSTGGRVELRGGAHEDSVWLEVADTGTGIPEHELPRIFDRLFRAAGAVRDQVPGAGLGLTISRAIVESHGGTIQAASQVGVGTTLRVTLPAAPADVSSVPDPVSS